MHMFFLFLRDSKIELSDLLGRTILLYIEYRWISELLLCGYIDRDYKFYNIYIISYEFVLL
jgi:hypothetical protein